MLECSIPSFFSRKGPFDPDFLQLLAHVILGEQGWSIAQVHTHVPLACMSCGRSGGLTSTLSPQVPYGKILEAVQRDGKAAAYGAVFLVLLALTKALGVW